MYINALFSTETKISGEFYQTKVGKIEHEEAFADFHTIKNKIYFVVHKKASIFHLQITDLNN